MKTDSDTLCLLPWASLSIGTLGQVLRCQMSRESMGHLADSRLDTIHDGGAYRELRESMRRGEWQSQRAGHLPGCSPCQARERDGVKSKRLHWRQESLVSDLWRDETFLRDSENPIVHLDLAFNNACNFRCRMCNSAFSTRWSADEKALRERGYPVPDRQSRESRTTDVDVLNRLKQFLPRLRSLRRLEVVGGEPFLVPEFLEFIDLLRGEDVLPNCEFMVTTNGSLLNEAILTKLVGFKKVVLNISIDATGSLFEYLRSSGQCRWEDIQERVHMALNFATEQNRLEPARIWRVNLNGAFQTYNMLNVEEFVEWLISTLRFPDKGPSPAARARHSFEHRLLYFPEPLSARHAPQSMIDESLTQIARLEERHPWLMSISESRYLADIKTHLRSGPTARSEELRRQFLRYTQLLDEIRGEEQMSVLPDVASHFREYL